MAASTLTRREFLRTASAAAAAGVLAGCGAAPARRAAEIRLAASVEDVPDAQLARFNRQFAPYHVTRAAVGPQQLVEILAADSAAAGSTGASAADVVALPAVKIPWLAGRGALRDLAGQFQASAKARQADLYGVDAYFTSGEQRWGLALSWSPDYLVWANTQLWQAAGAAVPDGPLSFAEWRALSARLSAVQKDGLPVFGTDFFFDFPALLWLAETLDPPARVFAEGGQRLNLLSHPGFVQAARFVLDWKQEGGIPYRRAIDPLKSYLPECT